VARRRHKAPVARIRDPENQRAGDRHRPEIRRVLQLHDRYEAIPRRRGTHPRRRMSSACGDRAQDAHAAVCRARACSNDPRSQRANASGVRTWSRPPSANARRLSGRRIRAARRSICRMNDRVARNRRRASPIIHPRSRVEPATLRLTGSRRLAILLVLRAYRSGRSLRIPGVWDQIVQLICSHHHGGLIRIREVRRVVMRVILRRPATHAQGHFLIVWTLLGAVPPSVPSRA
jgi:hypothetical protein